MPRSEPEAAGAGAPCDPDRRKVTRCRERGRQSVDPTAAGATLAVATTEVTADRTMGLRTIGGLTRTTIAGAYPYYYPGFSIGFGFGFPFGYSSFYYGYPYSSPYPYSYPYSYPYAYPYPSSSYAYPAASSAYPPLDTTYPRTSSSSPRSGVTVTSVGRVTLEITPGTAEVYADGDFVGVVDDFSASTPGLTLPPGRHHIEVRAPGYATMIMDTDVVAGQVVPYRGSLRSLRVQ